MIRYSVYHKDIEKPSVRETETLKEAFDDIVRSFTMEDVEYVTFWHDFTRIESYDDFKLFMSGAMFLKNHLTNI